MVKNKSHVVLRTMVGKRHELWQRFPGDVLPTGQNQLTLVHEKMGRAQLEHRIRIEEIVLFLYGS